jgi:hypothetical protein
MFFPNRQVPPGESSGGYQGPRSEFSRQEEDSFAFAYGRVFI